MTIAVIACLTQFYPREVQNSCQKMKSENEQSTVTMRYSPANEMNT
jgi:hypothetical protein